MNILEDTHHGTTQSSSYNNDDTLPQALINELIDQDNYEASAENVRVANDLLLNEVETYKRAHGDMVKHFEQLKSVLLQRNQELLEKDKLLAVMRDSNISGGNGGITSKLDRQKLEKKLNDRHHDALQKWHAKIDTQAAVIESLRNEIVTLKQDLHAKSSQLQRCTDEIIPVKNQQIAELTTRLQEEVNGEKQSIQTKALLEYETTARKLRQENALLHEQVTQLELSLREATRVAADAGTSQDASTKHALDLHSQHTLSEHAVTNAKLQVDYLANLNSSLKTQLTSMCDKHAALEAQHMLSEQTIKRLQLDLDDQQSSIEQEVNLTRAECTARQVHIQRDRDVCQRENEALQQEITVERERTARLGEQLISTESNFKQQIDQLRAHSLSLKRQVDEQKLKSDELINELQKQKNYAVQKLQEQLDSCMQSNERLNNDLQNRVLELGQLRAQLSRIKSLELQIAALSDERVRLRDQLDERMQQLAHLQQNISERDTLIEELTTKAVTLAKLVEDDSERYQSELRSLNHVHEDTVKNLQRSLEEKQYEFEQLAAKFSQLSTASHADAARSKQKTHKLHENMTILRSEVDKKDAKLRTFAVNGIKLDEYVALRDEVDSWRRKHEMFRRLLATTTFVRVPRPHNMNETRVIFGSSAAQPQPQLLENLQPAILPATAAAADIDTEDQSNELDSQLDNIKRRADLVEQRFNTNLQQLFTE